MRSLSIAAMAAAAATIAAPALADTLTLTVKIHATNLSPELTGVHAACSAFFDAARQQRFGPYPTNSAVVARTAAGSADGTVSVTIKDWVPEAKYWSCYLGNDQPGSTSAFYLPGDPSYQQVDQARRATSGTLLLTGTVP